MKKAPAKKVVAKKAPAKMAIKKTGVAKAQNGKLTAAELKSLSHQKRGMGNMSSAESFVKKRGSIKNDTGILSADQTKQLKEHMKKASLAQKIYEGLPNIGTIVGKSAADIPKGSQLEKQKEGGNIKRKSIKK